MTHLASLSAGPPLCARVPGPPDEALHRDWETKTKSGEQLNFYDLSESYFNQFSLQAQR